MFSWNELIKYEMEKRRDSWSEVEELHLEGERVSGTAAEIQCHPSMVKKFDNSHTIKEGVPFTLFTKRRVYFPATYDGAEWVRSVPRNPPESPEPTEHVGM